MEITSGEAGSEVSDNLVLVCQQENVISVQSGNDNCQIIESTSARFIVFVMESFSFS